MDGDPPCCVCRLKHRGCDRTKPVCEACNQRGLDDDCSYRPEDMPETRRPKKRQSEPNQMPMVLLDSPGPPSKQVRLAGPHRNDVRPLGNSQFRRSFDVRATNSLRERSLAPIITMEDAPSSPGSPEVSDYSPYHSPSVETWERDSVSPPDQESQPNNVERAPGSSSSGRQYTQTRLTRIERAVAERTDNVKQEESAEIYRGWTQPSGPSISQLPSANESSTMSHIARVPKELSDRLIAAYITREYVNLPIFDLSDFKSAYEASKTRENVADMCGLFGEMLNRIFILSSMSLNTMADAELFPLFSRGRKLTGFSEGHGDPWSAIQFYILQCQYLNAVGDPRQAWSLIGFTLRTAQTLGLHSKTQGVDAYSRKRRELARKLWHAVIIMERMIALQIGILPQTPSSFRVPLPTHLDTDYIDAISDRDSGTGVERPSMIEFLAACARLYAHVEDILAVEDELRIRQDGCPAKKLRSLDLNGFFKADSLLHDWNVSLPSFLRKDLCNESSTDPIIHRQRNICRIRYLYIRVRLYRSFLILALALSANCKCKSGGTVHISGNESVSPDSPLALSLVRDASFKCVATAMELVDILKTHERGMPSNRYGHCQPQTIIPLPSFWENVDYLYVCGTVFLAARLCPLFPRHDMNSPVNTWEIGGKWSDLLALLEHYEKICRTKEVKNVAEACCRTLRTLSDAVKSPAQADVTAAFDNGTRARMFQRIGVEVPARGRNGSLNTPGSEPADTMSAKGHLSLSWIESLPIDLDS